MKNQIKNTKSLFVKAIISGLSIISLTIHSGCNPNNPNPNCSSSNTVFNQLYNNQLSNNTDYQDVNSVDLEIHSYTFNVSSAQTICKIGYQGNAAATSPYTIRIRNAANNQIIYTGSFTFSNTQTSYVNVGPIALQPGINYKIERELNSQSNFANLTGRIMRRDSAVSNVSFPITNGVLTITSSSFSGMGGPIVDAYLPYIDIVFQ